VDETTSPKYAVFCPVAVPNKLDGTLNHEHAQIWAVTERIKMQLRIVNQSDAASLLHKPVAVFFTVAGQDISLETTASSVQRVLAEACSEMPNLSCRPLYNFHRNYEGETLRQLQRLWTFFFPGNMFAASCDYVNRLVPPEELSVKCKSTSESCYSDDSDRS
jgi:hypothetical protein